MKKRNAAKLQLGPRPRISLGGHGLGHQNNRFFFEELCPVQAAHFVVGGTREGEVELIPHQLFNEHKRCADLCHDFRRLGLLRLDQLRHQAFRQSFDDSDSVNRLQVRPRLHEFGCIFERMLTGKHILEEQHGLFRQHDRSTAAIKELHLKLLFQPRHGFRDRRLGHAQLLCGRRKASLGRNRQKSIERLVEKR